MTEINVTDHRVPDQPIDPQFFTRWSPRAFSSKPVTEQELLTLFEAARWAPSCFNEQPWTFFYALNGDDHWNKIFDTLVEFNQGWAKPAGALILIAARKTFAMNGKPNAHAEFDAGAAWMSLALQAQKMGLVTHAMAGLDLQTAASNLELTEDYTPICAVAIGHIGANADLPAAMAEKEIPNARKPVSDFATHGPLK